MLCTIKELEWSFPVEKDALLPSHVISEFCSIGDRVFVIEYDLRPDVEKPNHLLTDMAFGLDKLPNGAHKYLSVGHYSSGREAKLAAVDYFEKFLSQFLGKI